MGKRIAGILLAVLILVFAMPARVGAVSTSATAAILVDADSGRVLYEQNADARMLIASTTKIMTALVAIREGNLSDTVKVSKKAAYTEGSSMYLKVGEELTLETLLYGLMLCSGNDAAVAIAEHVGGSEAGFAELMNETAAELGMEHTSFANPNGLDHEDHYSTARDMAVLACAAMNNEILARIVSTRTVTIGGRTMTNHNKLLSYMDGCIGLKTGYYFAYAVLVLVSSVRIARAGQKKQALLQVRNLVLFGLMSMVAMLILLWPMVRKILSYDYAGRYAYYNFGGLTLELAAQALRIGLLNFILIGLGLLPSGQGK